MIKNYFKTAFRTLRRHPGYTAINLTGLTVGMAVCLLMLLFVRHEYSINRTFENGDDIYRVNSIWHEQGDAERLVSFSPLAAALEADFTGVRNAIRYTAVDADLLIDNQPSRVSTIIADPDLFTMFDFEFIAGDPATALDEPNSAVLTDEEAQRLFGTTDVVGRTIQMLTWGGEGKKDFQVTGVFRHPSYNSVTYIGQDAQQLILPFSNVADYFGDAAFDTDWGIYNTVTFVELAEGVEAATLVDQFEPMLAERLPNTLSGTVSLTLEPLRDVYLNENDGTARRLSTLLLVLAGLILGVGCFNFVNISTAQAMGRGREVGMRKVLGAEKTQLVAQYIGEGLLLSISGMLAALGIAWMMLPSFNALVERSLAFSQVIEILPFLIGIVLLTGFIGGIYPAFYLSALHPSYALKNLNASGGVATGTRRILVVGQFVIAIGLFVSALVIHRQADHIAGQDTGFEQEQVLVVSSLPREWTPEGVDKLDVIKQQVASLPSVTATSIAWGPPGPRYTGVSGEFLKAGATSPQSIPVSQVDAGFLETLDLELAAGQFFETAQASSTPSVVFNETAVHQFGWDNPVGQQVTWGESVYTVLGVVKDYHTAGLEQPVGPVALVDVRQSPLYRELLVRIAPGATEENLTQISEAWSSVYPETVFEYYFLDDQWNDLHRWIWQTQRIAGVATFLAIIIACLGLLGLVSITVSRRTREIGIRKVLGARVIDVAGMLVKDYLVLVAIAFAIGAPLALFVMRRWLDGFATAITLGPSLFLLAGFVIAMLAALLVAAQSLSAALANPVDTLRNES